jgi:hypothetical protein
VRAACGGLQLFDLNDTRDELSCAARRPAPRENETKLLLPASLFMALPNLIRLAARLFSFQKKIV